MKYNECFKSGNRFADRLNFPYGFQKSGEFTIEQARLLEKNGCAYQALSEGVRRPIGEVEREFVSYCQHKKNADSIHERIWHRYLETVKRSKRMIAFGNM